MEIQPRGGLGLVGSSQCVLKLNHRMGLIPFALVLMLVLLGCSDSPRTPTVPDRSLNSLRLESVSTSITAGDYRTFSVRVRVNETSGTSVVISDATLQFAGDGSSVTQTFSHIPRNTIGPGATVDRSILAPPW